MKIKLLLLSLLITSATGAQNFIMKEKLADDYYNRYNYYKAIPMYEQLIPGSPDNMGIYEKLADSYRKVNDSKNAERCYAFLVNSPSSKHEHLLFYAQALSRNGKYDQAAVWFQKYSEAEPSDIRGTGFSVLYRNMNSIYSDSSRYIIVNAPFNSETSDFSPSYFGNDIHFISARKKASIIRDIYNRTNTSYLDLFITSPDSKNALPFSTDINSKYHEGPVTFTRNLDTIIFTRSNFYNKHFGKSNEGINKLKLYLAVWNRDLKKWTNIVPLPFNNDQYSVGHPAFSADGKTLYFASDMPGGVGGTDIYMSHLIADHQGNKSWSQPINLGSEINTPGNEMFPFIDNDGNLWYASDGLAGLGGLDVFMAGRKNDGFLKPLNPGYPLNTRFDDFGYITKNSGEEGYISSDRNNKNGDDDIYKVTRLVIPAKTELVKLVELKHVPKFKLTGKVYSADKLTPIPNSTAFLTNKSDSSVKEAKCDSTGTFTFNLEAESDYSVKVSVQTSGSKCSSNPNECSTRGLSTDVNFNQSFPVFCVGDVIKVENIYYDLGKFNIRSDAAIELDKLFDIMNTYPHMKIELRSHTDSRGTAISNMALSDKRANAAAEYLFSKGITRDRITAKGFGDTMPVNNCIKGAKCTEDEYKVNRRTEFKILSIE
jgi:outer membrane protein OmpA-like peptidoglycan-associated protein/tetratricopeptide (TPR) repeat protein